MTKEKQLECIAQEIEQCEVCKVHSIGQAVPGEGSAQADIVFLGEAPGKQEAKTGRPFIGPSGKLLRKLIADAGLKEDEVYITSPVKRLPTYVTPKPADIRHGLTHLQKQLAVIQPKYIVLLGSTAVQAMLGEKLPIMKVHGTTVNRDSRTYFITLHPAAALRNPPTRKYLLADFAKLNSLLAIIPSERT